MRMSSWENFINLILGLWLIVTPWIIPIEHKTTQAVQINRNNWVIGSLIFAISALALLNWGYWEEKLVVLLGIWIFISPWVFGYSQETQLLWNSLFVGFATVFFALMSLPQK